MLIFHSHIFEIQVVSKSKQQPCTATCEIKLQVTDFVSRNLPSFWIRGSYIEMQTRESICIIVK